jgi:hypothetical protein
MLVYGYNHGGGAIIAHWLADGGEPQIRFTSSGLRLAHLTALGTFEQVISQAGLLRRGFLQRRAELALPDLESLTPPHHRI